MERVLHGNASVLMFFLGGFFFVYLQALRLLAVYEGREEKRSTAPPLNLSQRLSNSCHEV